MGALEGLLRRMEGQHVELEVVFQMGGKWTFFAGQYLVFVDVDLDVCPMLLFGVGGHSAGSTNVALQFAVGI